MVEADAVGVGVVRRAVGALRSVRSFGTTPPWSPGLPPGRAWHLPGRGEALVRDAHSGSAGRPPVLLLHGWTWSLDVNYFGLMPELVAAGRPFVGIDHRGHAGGLPIHGEPTLEDCAQDVRCVLDSMSVDKVIVCGFSPGGPVGLHFALANP